MLLPQDEEASQPAHERTVLLGTGVANVRGDQAHSILSSAVSKEEQALGGTAVGERLPYNDYTTIDWLHDLVNCRV